MRIKAKVTVGVIFLFGTILAISGISLYYIHRLSVEGENIIKDNYESLQYSRQIMRWVENPRLGQDSLEFNLGLQEKNITEPGEREETNQLRMAFERWKKSPNDIALAAELRTHALAIHEINMKAIYNKNEVAQATSKEASKYVLIFVSMLVLLTFSLIVNFPGYIAGPIVQLTQSIKLIANKNYEERLNFDRSDEFQELAEAFNQMAEKLDEYEHSGLAKLIFEKERIETIINRMNDPVIGLDESSRIIFVNEQALTLLNLTTLQLVGRYAPDVAVQNDLLRTLLQDEVMAGGSRLFKIVLGGRENYFSKEKIPIRYRAKGESANKLIGHVIFLKNITTYKERDLAKTNFIATISHELKTPIASIQMCSKLLQDKRVGELNPEQAGLLKTMSDETERLARITHELLDLSQVETGNLKLDIRKANPQDIMDVALEAVKFHADRKRVKIKVGPTDAVAFVQADSDKTSWVLVNLLTNAIRFSMENDQVELTCTSDGSQVAFSVKDNGPGIDEKYLPRLFDKFYQVPGSHSGTGLGLAISKEFIEAQGGSISVTSAVGKGSVFRFRLPCVS